MLLSVFILTSMFCIMNAIPKTYDQVYDIIPLKEWWIQVEIFTENINQDLNDQILIEIYSSIIEEERDYILSWHFFRELHIRFRIETVDEVQRNRIADRLVTFLSSLETVEEFYFANHSKKVDDLDKGYDGEYSTYKRMWPYQKKIWEWGSEMTVEAINEEYETGTNEPSRKYQLTRTYHLLANQLSLGYDIWYCFSLNHNGGIIVWCSLIISFLIGFTVCYYLKRRNRVSTSAKQDLQ